MRRSPVRSRAVAALLGLVLGAPSAHAQAMGPGGVSWAAVPAMESYQFLSPGRVGMRGITLMSVPIAGRVALHPRATVDVAGAWASGALTLFDGSTRTLRGFTDATLQLSGTLIPDRVTVVLSAAAPTGVATHDSAQALVAGVIAADLLPFRVMTWGAGGGIGGQLLVTQRVGRTGLGFSTGVRRAGDFEPLATERFVYRPGLETVARVGIDQDLTGGGKLSLTAGVQSFADDQVDGQNLFRSGPRVTAIGSVGVPVRGGGSAAVYAGVLHRSRGSYLDATQSASPAQDLLLLGGLLRRPVGRGTLSPRADLRLFRSADGIGQGYLAGFGVGFEERRAATVVAPVVTVRTGRVMVREGIQSALLGLDLGVSVRFTGGGR